jgi:catechol 2,3-dioxygenase-like lactoylglutathione lyase family enzyme
MTTNHPGDDSDPASDPAGEEVGFRLDAAVPILVTTDLGRALDHYRRLGFAVRPDESGVYGFLGRDGTSLHIAVVHGIGPDSAPATYLYVDDADALIAAWRAAGVDGRFHDPTDTPYGLREGAHVDPDGNLLRVGSWLPGHGPR